MQMIFAKQIVWVAYTNSDLTEGRGDAIPIAVCYEEATARRLGRKRSVQGSDCVVESMHMINVDGKWYVPSVAVNIVAPTSADMGEQAAIYAKIVTMEKAIAVGLTAADLHALGVIC